MMSHSPSLIAARASCVVIVFLLGMATVQRNDEILQLLVSNDPAVRLEAENRILSERDELIRKCEELARQLVSVEDKKESVKSAILLLGKLRAVQSVPLLVENLTFSVMPKPLHTPAVEDICPCVQALQDIGSASLDDVIRNVKRSRDKDVFQCAAAILRRVWSKDMAIAYVRYEIEREPRTAEKSTLVSLSNAL